MAVTVQKFPIVNNLSKAFGSVEALRGINFDLEPGEALGVVGQLLSSVYAHCQKSTPQSKL